MIMKKSLLSKLAILGIGSLMCAGGIFAGLKNNQNKKAAAATTYTYYFSPDSGWASDKATFQIDFRGNDGGWLDKRYSMKKVELSATAKTHLGISTDLYKYESDAEYSKIYFGRFSEDGSTQWNYSSAISTNGNKVFIKEHNDFDNWTNINGKYNLDAIYKGNECNISSETTGRVFLYNSGTKWSDGSTNAVRAWGGSASTLDGANVSASVYMLNWFSEKIDGVDEHYAYADIPTDVSGFQFVCLNGNQYSSSVNYYQQNESFKLENGCFAGVYYASGNDSKDKVSISLGGAHNDKAGATLLEKVFSACYSCSSSGFNGYGAADKLYDRFYSHAVAGSLSTIVDTSYTIEQKMAQMAELYNKANPGSSIPGYGAYSSLKVDLNDSSSAITIGTILTTMTVGFGLLFLKKKKVA